jgi:uncharacterized protein (TIGR04255 family)
MSTGVGQTAMPLPKYRNPPVVEVVIGLSLAPITKLSSVHYGAFWEIVKSEYPYSEDNAPLVEEVPAVQFEVLQMPPLRRVFLIHTDRTYLMQLQQDRFVHNWRKTKDSDEYPNFQAAKEKFLHGWELFQKFVAEKQLGTLEVKGYEVTYINHFIEKPGSFPLAAETYLPVFNWKGARSDGFLPDPSVLGLDLRFPMPDNRGFLRVSVKHGKRPTDDADVMLMQMTAQGSAKQEESDMESWLELAHEWIVRGFTDLTSKQAHEKWEKYQ